MAKSEYERYIRTDELFALLSDKTSLAAHDELHVLLRSLFELDEMFRSWRCAHFRLVERQIGAYVDSLKGVPAEQLMHGMREHLMPDLWAAVNELTRRVNTYDSQASSSPP